MLICRPGRRHAVRTNEAAPADPRRTSSLTKRHLTPVPNRIGTERNREDQLPPTRLRYRRSAVYPLEISSVLPGPLGANVSVHGRRVVQPGEQGLDRGVGRGRDYYFT